MKDQAEAMDPLMRAALEMAESGAFENDPVISTEAAPVQPRDTAHSGTAPTELSAQETPRSAVPEGEPIGLTVRQRLTLDEVRYAGHSIEQVGMALKRMGPEAIRGVINQGLCSAPDMGSSTRAQVLRRKLDAGESITPSELGHLYDALCREPTQWESASGQAVAPETLGKASPALTAEEKGAILAYKSSESYKINAALRDGVPLTQEQHQMVDWLDKALPALPIYQGEVYRRISFDMEGQVGLDIFLAEHQPGSYVRYPAFTSTSIQVDGYPVEGKLTVTIVIQSKTGRNLEGVGNNIEQEIVFPRNSIFLVDKVEVNQSGSPVIYMKEIQENGVG